MWCLAQYLPIAAVESPYVCLNLCFSAAPPRSLRPLHIPFLTVSFLPTFLPADLSVFLLRLLLVLLLDLPSLTFRRFCCSTEGRYE